MGSLIAGASASHLRERRGEQPAARSQRNGCGRSRRAWHVASHGASVLSDAIDALAPDCSERDCQGERLASQRVKSCGVRRSIGRDPRVFSAARCAPPLRARRRCRARCRRAARRARRNVRSSCNQCKQFNAHAAAIGGLRRRAMRANRSTCVFEQHPSGLLRPSAGTPRLATAGQDGVGCQPDHADDEDAHGPPAARWEKRRFKRGKAERRGRACRPCSTWPLTAVGAAEQGGGRAFHVAAGERFAHGRTRHPQTMHLVALHARNVEAVAQALAASSSA